MKKLLVFLSLLLAFVTFNLQGQEEPKTKEIICPGRGVKCKAGKGMFVLYNRKCPDCAAMEIIVYK